MRPVYLLDACALTAFFADEAGADKVAEIFALAEKNECALFMHRINLLEVYYGVWKKVGKTLADEILADVQAAPIALVDSISEEVFHEAARLKASYRISLADAIALAEAKARQASIVTCDHHEFDAMESAEHLLFSWIR